MMVLRASQRPRESRVTTYQPRCTTTLKSQHIKTQNGCAGKGCWPHPRVRSLSRGGPGGHCRYPEDRVPPRTSFKSRQRLPPPAEGSFEVVTCPHGSGSYSWLGAAPGLPRVPVARPPAPGSEQLRGRNVSPRLGLPLPARGSSGAVMCPHGLGQLRGRHVLLGPRHPPSDTRAAPELPRVTWAQRVASK
jgi:hypothetical protein